MKKFFSAFLLMAAVAFSVSTFVACNDEPNVDEPQKEYALELTSETTMQFPAEGGEGVIEWVLNEVTRTSPVAQPEPQFSTEAEWITLDANKLGAFAVAVNEGEAREAVIKVAYAEQLLEVVVKQAAAEAPVEATELAAAVRIPSEELGLENNIYLQIGLLMLIGLLAKTAILITEYALERRRKGLGIVEAAYAAAEARLRPILMTVLTMIIGMIPLVLMTGAGANGNRTIGIAVIGGMFVGTLAILLSVPVFFIFFEWLQEKIRPAMIEEPDQQILMERERIRHEREEREQKHNEKY